MTNQGHLTDRANKFAQQYVKKPSPEPEKGPGQDEQLASLLSDYEPKLKSARAAVKSTQAKSSNAGRGKKQAVIDAGAEDARYIYDNDPAVYYVNGGMSNKQTKVYTKGSVSAKWLAKQGWTEVEEG